MIKGFLACTYTRSIYREALLCHPNRIILLHDRDNKKYWSYDKSATKIHELFPNEFDYFNHNGKRGITFPEQMLQSVVKSLIEDNCSCVICDNDPKKTVDMIKQQLQLE